MRRLRGVCHKYKTRGLIHYCGTHRLAGKAFQHVLGRKQSRYREVLVSLDGAIRETVPMDGKELQKLNRIVKRGNEIFRGYKY